MDKLTEEEYGKWIRENPTYAKIEYLSREEIIKRYGFMLTEEQIKAIKKLKGDGN